VNQLDRIKAIIAADPVRLHVLQLVRELRLPDCWVAAGFVRSAVWDHLHQRSSSPLPLDIDVIWFDGECQTAQKDVDLEAVLQNIDASINWSVKNQARMHFRNGDHPYINAAQAMTFWPETATAIGVRLDESDLVEVAAPLGLDDLLNLVVRPTARFRSEKRHVYLERVRSKGWLETWPRLKLLGEE
jgi:hypothetical protein